MGRASPGQTSFNAGELSPLLAGRPDIQKYGSGCSVLEGYIPTVQGPAVRCPGFRYAGPNVNASYRSWLRRFEFNYTQAFILEFNNNALGFWNSRARVTVARNITNVADNGVGFMRVTATGHLFFTGNTVTIAAVTGSGGVTAVNGTHSIVRVDANNFDIAVAMAGTYGAGGTATGPYNIATSYADAGLVNSDGTSALSQVQTGDIVYLAGGGIAAQKLSRLGNTNWTIAELQPDDGPYMDANTDESITVYASAETGTGITLTASSSIFTADHVGALVRIEPVNISIEQWEPTTAASAGNFRRYGSNVYECTDVNGANTGTVPPTHTRGKQKDGSGTAWKEWEYLHSGYGVVRITAAAGTTATADVISRLPADVVTVGNATWRWRFGAWGAHNEFPKYVVIWRDRLVFAGLRTLWFSKAGEYEKFSPDEYGQVTTASGITIQIGAVDNNAIRWLAAGDSLMVGTVSTEFAVSENASGDPVGPANIKAPPRSSRGGRSVSPVKLGESEAAFVDAAGRRLWEVASDRETGVYQTIDRTVLSEHITAGGLTEMALQRNPVPVLWSCTEDGQLLGMTYDRDQEVWGWFRRPMGASRPVQSLATLRAPDGTRDDLWVATDPTVGGRWIEYLADRAGDDDDPRTVFYVDAGLTYDGSVAATLQPGTGATVYGTTGVTFTAGASVFSAGDVGRYITRRYQDSEDRWTTARALITAYTSATEVQATITAPFPSITSIASGGWALTATTVTGLEHLETQTVAVLTDGATHPERTVSGGAITLAVPASYVQVGLAYTTRLRTMRPEAGRRDGYAQGKTQRVHRVIVRLDRTVGASVGPTFDNLDTMNFRQPADLTTEPPPIYTGDKELTWPGGYETDGYICVTQPDPLPQTVVAVFPVMEVSDR